MNGSNLVRPFDSAGTESRRTVGSSKQALVRCHPCFTRTIAARPKVAKIGIGFVEDLNGDGTIQTRRIGLEYGVMIT